MNNSFSIEIDNAELEETYFLNGECEIKGKNVSAFNIGRFGNHWVGFGGGGRHALPAIARLQIEIKYAGEIIKKIENQIKEGVY